MLPQKIVQAISTAKLPCFIYDVAAIRPRAAAACSLLERFFFPVKACPEAEVVRAVAAAGSGLDLCSQGDAEIAAAAGCPGERWKFTSACAGDRLMLRLHQAGALLDADSVEQGLRWGSFGGTVCGLRIATKEAKALYGSKFGVPAQEIVVGVRRLADAGVGLEGLHIHDQHANLSPAQFASCLAGNLAQVDNAILRRCRYVNIGGSWPMRHGHPAPVEDLRTSLRILREHLAALGFEGALYGEPGRWIVGPCGYWAARVAALKAHPEGAQHRVVILDTSTPVPCRHSLSPFAVLREGRLLNASRNLDCDIYGSANTALDLIGKKVRLPPLALDDVVVALGQGAYTRSLIPPFNERERPAAMVIGN